MRVIVNGPEPPRTEVLSCEAGDEVRAEPVSIGPLSLVETDVPAPFQLKSEEGTLVMS